MGKLDRSLLGESDLLSQKQEELLLLLPLRQPGQGDDAACSGADQRRLIGRE